MKILMIAPQPFFQPRGTPFSVLHRLRALSQLGHEIDLLTYPIGEEQVVPNVRILRSAGVPGIRTIKVGPSLRKIPLDLVLFTRVLRQIRRERYDAIHTHEEACFLGAYVSKRRGIPHIYDMHSSLPQQLENYGFLAYRPVLGLGRMMERFVLKNSAAVIAICESLRDIALQQGAKADRLFLIHNQPVDSGRTPSFAEMEAFRQEIAGTHGIQLAGKPLVLYTGTFEQNQGLDLMIRAFKKATAQTPDAILGLVGGTPTQVDWVRGLVQQERLEGRVLVVGRRPVEEMDVWTASATILTSPRSRGTNTPLKIYSYLRSGKPILATDLETHRQVLDSSTALLVAPQEDALAEGLMCLLTEPELRNALAENARKVAAERYSEDRYLERHKDLLRTVFGTSAA